VHVQQSIYSKQFSRGQHRYFADADWGKGKERDLYGAFLAKVVHSSAQAWITQFYLQITPCLPFLREHSPDVTTTATEAAGIQLQLTTHLSTPKG